MAYLAYHWPGLHDIEFDEEKQEVTFKTSDDSTGHLTYEWVEKNMQFP